ncbi:MAG: hypothetical protein K0S31_3584 [Sphingobacterium multivorum]|jgi:hypothetical protein|nr:hypothetical protein [Sphingobacterium multivorum]
MVDQERRKMLAYHLRHLVIGRISNDEFEEEMKDIYCPQLGATL